MSSEMFTGAATAYDRYVGRYSPALARAMCDLVGVERGRALDVGCGTGALLAELASRLGAGNVAGIDPSEPFTEAARARVPGVRVLVGPAESLPFGDGEFELAISQLVVNFVHDPGLALREKARVTVSGGTVAGCVWDYGGGMTMVRTFWEAAAALDPERAKPYMEQFTMRFARPAELEELWRETGLESVEVAPLDVEAAYDDFDDLWAPFPTGVGPAGAYTAALDPAAQEALRQELHRRLDSPSGSFTLTARAWCASGVTSK